MPCFSHDGFPVNNEITQKHALRLRVHRQAEEPPAVRLDAQHGAEPVHFVTAHRDAGLAVAVDDHQRVIQLSFKRLGVADINNMAAMYPDK